MISRLHAQFFVDSNYFFVGSRNLSLYLMSKLLVWATVWPPKCTATHSWLYCIVLNPSGIRGFISVITSNALLCSIRKCKTDANLDSPNLFTTSSFCGLSASHSRTSPRLACTPFPSTQFPFRYLLFFQFRSFGSLFFFLLNYFFNFFFPLRIFIFSFIILTTLPLNSLENLLVFLLYL